MVPRNSPSAACTRHIKDAAEMNTSKYERYRVKGIHENKKKKGSHARHQVGTENSLQVEGWDFRQKFSKTRFFQFFFSMSLLPPPLAPVWD